MTWSKFLRKHFAVLFIIFGVSALMLFIIVSQTLIIIARSTPQTPFNSSELGKIVPSDNLLVSKVISTKDLITRPVVTKDDPMVGLSTAKHTVVMYSDVACEYCRNQEKNLKKIMAKLPTALRLVWKDYPEPGKQSRSWRAAVAGRCAQIQNKFWAYHDNLLADPADLSTDRFIAEAKKLNLDTIAFGHCLKTNQSADRIEKNIIEANALNISGVPDIFINNTEIMGESDYGKLLTLVTQD
ncbi:MAG: thioredoxin domain-containing protein [Candidatus Falkowbacteria bacterium]